MKMSIKYCPNNQIKDFGFTRSDMEGYVKEVNLSNSDDNFHEHTFKLLKELYSIF
jgi:hypothetical protein